MADTFAQTPNQFLAWNLSTQCNAALQQVREVESSRSNGDTHQLQKEHHSRSHAQCCQRCHGCILDQHTRFAGLPIDH
jgi:hypothetical protein